MPFDIFPFDPCSAAPCEWRLLNALENSHQREVYPEDPPVPVEVHRRLWSVEIPLMRRFVWLAVDAFGDPAGYATCDLEDLPENHHLAFSDLYVAPHHRRQGLGSRLLAHVIELPLREGRRTVIGETDLVPAGSSDSGNPDCAGLAFTRRLGGEPGLEMQHRQLDLAQVDRDLLAGWVARAAGLRADRGGEFELVCMGIPAPEAELERICRMMEAINEAPRGSLDMADNNFTPDFIRQMEAFHLQRGTKLWTIAARHLPSGEFAGHTQIFQFLDKPCVGIQGATSVRKDFRNRGLGRWLKAEMALKIMAEHPQIRYFRTANADENAPMLNINAEMGFQFYHSHVVVQAPVEAVAKFVGG